MRRILSTLVVLALASAVLIAQQWDRVNGSMQTRGSTTAPLVIIDQVSTGKILSLRDNGVEVWSVADGGAVVATGTESATGYTATSGGFTDSAGGGGLFIFSNAVQFRRNASTADAEIYAGGSVGLQIDGTTQGLKGVAARITAGSATGLTVDSVGVLQRQVYKVTIDRTAFVSAATTSDVTIGTLPAKTAVVSVYAQVTQTFACTATCTSSTLSMMLGKGAGGAEYLASGLDIDAATTVFGDADAEMGTLMTRAAAIQGGTMNSFSATQAVVMRLTSGTGNIGNGSATNLSQGSVTFYVVTERMP